MTKTNYSLLEPNVKYKVWWIPQVPGKPFEVSVATIEEGARLLDVLANYDLFQFANRIKGDYANAGGLMVFEDSDWCDWMDEETGETDVNKFLKNNDKVEA